MRKLYCGVENLIEVARLVDQAGGQYVADATLAFSLWNSDETEKIADSRPLNYVAGSDGTYQGSLPADTSLAAGGDYVLEIVGVRDGTTIVREWHRCRAVRKGLD